MTIWLIWFFIIVLIVATISFASVRKLSKAQFVPSGELDNPIPEQIEEHPYTFNPILWIILIVAFFTGIMIFSYAATYGTY